MKKPFISLFSGVFIILSMLTVQVASAQLLYEEGEDYTVLKDPLPLNQSGQKEVVEFFSYACPHCANLEPYIIEWETNKKPKDVGFYQIPAVGGKIWTFVAQAKYTANKLKLGHAFDQAYFDAVHKDNNRRLLGSQSDVIQFMVKSGADKEKAEKAWQSLQVKSNLKKSAKLWRQAELSGVPAVIVNGKYLVELKQYSQFFDIIDYLLKTTQP